MLGGKVGELPTIYLGMPLGAKSKAKGIWNNVLEKCEKKLANWKNQYLSMGGRWTLINSVLDAMPTYMMSLFPAPVYVVKRIDAMRRNFLWEGNSEKKKFHLVKWNDLTTSKRTGVLGIKNLKVQNQCLLMKWLWKLAVEDQTLWIEVIREKYGREGNWTTKPVRSPYGVSLWRSIRNLWPKVINKSKFKVGSGSKVSLWNDNWLGQRTLKSLFPDIHELNQQQEAALAEVWTAQGWNLTFRRMLNDWEIDKFTEFYRVLEQFNGTNASQDLIMWQGNGQEKFSVRSAYKEYNISNNQIGCWPWKMIWKVKIPYKVACFTWLLAKNAVLTQDNLTKRGFQLCSRGYLCGDQAKTINHLFFALQVHYSDMEVEDFH